jgi:hypothetical protein
MKCAICGKEFIAGTLQAKFCSDDCRRINKLECQRKYYKPKKQKTDVKKGWSEIVSICSELGMSYGEAVSKGVFDD